MAEFEIQRLGKEHASLIVDCTRRVYGERYAHATFYDVSKLQQAMENGKLMSVGAITYEGRLVGHMAMTNRGDRSTPELGNTMVDPNARGDGLAWKVGAALIDWCKELGHRGFLHYPTTEHTTMQKRSVNKGFETGLMMSYIPGEEVPRQAATVVYEPLGDANGKPLIVPECYQDLIRDLVTETGLRREITQALNGSERNERYEQSVWERRGLAKLTVFASGESFEAALAKLLELELPRYQIDFLLDDPRIDQAVRQAQLQGFVFCGWLPGYQSADVLRLQKWSAANCEMSPVLAGLRAQTLLQFIKNELA